MNYQEAVSMLKSINNQEDFNRFIDCSTLHIIFKLQDDRYIKEFRTEVSKEEFKENRKIKDPDTNYRYYSKRYNFSAEKSGTVYFRRDYTLK